MSSRCPKRSSLFAAAPELALVLVEERELALKLVPVLRLALASVWASEQPLAEQKSYSVLLELVAPVLAQQPESSADSVADYSVSRFQSRKESRMLLARSVTKFPTMKANAPKSTIPGTTGYPHAQYGRGVSGSRRRSTKSEKKVVAY